MVCQKVFFEDLIFEKYADFVINFPILFLQEKENYMPGYKYIFGDFMNGKINEINNRLPSENDLSNSSKHNIYREQIKKIY